MIKYQMHAIKTQCNDIACMDTVIHNIKPNVVPKTHNVRKHPCFKLIRKNTGMIKNFNMLLYECNVMELDVPWPELKHNILNSKLL